MQIIKGKKSAICILFFEKYADKVNSLIFCLFLWASFQRLFPNTLSKGPLGQRLSFSYCAIRTSAADSGATAQYAYSFKGWL